MVLWLNTFSNNYRGPIVAFIPHVKGRGIPLHKKVTLSQNLQFLDFSKFVQFAWNLVPRGFRPRWIQKWRSFCSVYVPSSRRAEGAYVFSPQRFRSHFQCRTLPIGTSFTRNTILGGFNGARIFRIFFRWSAELPWGPPKIFFLLGLFRTFLQPFVFSQKCTL